MTHDQHQGHLPTDLGKQGIGPNTTGSGDDFHQAVAMLKKCLDGASRRHDQAFVEDVKKALDILGKWTDREKTTEAKETRRRLDRIREMRRGRP